MMKVVKWLDEHMEEFLLVILLVVIACVSLLQVIIRKIPWIPHPLSGKVCILNIKADFFSNNRYKNA